MCMIAVNWKRTICATWLLVFTPLALTAAHAALTTSEIDLVKKEFILKAEEPYGEDSAEAFVQKYQHDAVPILVGLLKEPISVKSKVMVVFHLGKFKDASVVPVLVGVIEETLKSPVTETEVDLLQWTTVGLGFTDAPEAYAYLMKMTSNKYWKDAKLVPFGTGKSSTPGRLRLRLRSFAVAGIAAGRSESARAHLEELRRKGPADLSAKVDGWVKEIYEPTVGKPRAVP